MKSNRAGIVLTLALLLTAAAAAPSPAAQTTAALAEMNIQKDGSRLVVQLKVEGTYAVEATYMPSPPRLVIDLTPMAQIRIPAYTQVDDIGVLDIRTGQFQPETARVVFDLSANTPAYSIIQDAEGLKISFWFEGEVLPLEAPAPEPAKPEAEKPKPAETKAPAVETPREPRPAGRDEFFVALRTGLSLFLGSDLSVRKEFELYGETGTLDEAYSFKAVPAFELQFGKYLGRTKLGLGVTTWSIKEPGTFTASLPHPFLMDAYRTVVFPAANLKYPAWNFSAFAQFSILETDQIVLSGGPMLGLTTGKTMSLDNFAIGERSPFTAADVTVSNLTYIEEDFSELLFGGLLGLEYRPMPRLSVLLDLRLIYLNPKNVALNQRLYLLHFQPVLGIQYNF